MVRRAVHRISPTLGVDIGQQRDPTAIAVAEVEPRASGLAAGRPERHYLIRHLERLPLRTPYDEVARRIESLCRAVHRRTGEPPSLFVDATGVGKPVVDLLTGAGPQARRLWAVTFTPGDRRTEDRAGRRISLGKAFLVRRLQALLQSRRIHLPRGHREAAALATELLGYEIRVDENAHARFGAFRVGTHDDLVTALGLAVQAEPSADTGPGSAFRGHLAPGL